MGVDKRKEYENENRMLPCPTDPLSQERRKHILHQVSPEQTDGSVSGGQLVSDHSRHCHSQLANTELLGSQRRYMDLGW